MLDLFDEIHDKLDFSEVSKDINDLRDRIASESQWAAIIWLPIISDYFILNNWYNKNKKFN